MTDPIADMLTRIRNALAVRKVDVVLPYSRLKAAIADILMREGWVAHVEHLERDFGQLRLVLKYDATGRPAIHSLKRMSRPGRRTYAGHDELRAVKNGYGCAIISTSRGVMTNKEAHKLGVGGELLCEIS